jgi:hypothetical protein
MDDNPETQIVAIGYQAGAIHQGTQSIAIGYQAGLGIGMTGNWHNGATISAQQVKKLRYVVKFQKPVNVIDLYGRICSATKNRKVVELLHKLWFDEYAAKITYVGNRDDAMADTLIFANICFINTIWGFDYRQHAELFDIVTEVDELMNDADKDCEVIDAHLLHINERKIGLLDTIMGAVRAFADEQIDEGAVKEAMAPAAVAAMLATSESESDTDDSDDMLDRLEAFAAECDKKLSPIVSCGWVIE